MTFIRSTFAVVIGLYACFGLAAADIFAGSAKIEITPPIGYPMWGYANRHDRPANGTLGPLFARMVVISDGKESIAIVSLDLGRPPTRERSAKIRARIAELGIRHMFLVASHTHHGPVLELEDWPAPDNSYVDQLDAKIVEAIIAARKNQQPAKLFLASANLELNRNRQSKRPEAQVDRELKVLRLEGRDGKVIATCVNFAAHPTMLDGKVLKWSADFPGTMAQVVEQTTKTPCLFLQGASGDLSVQSLDRGNGPEAFGALLAKHVMELGRSATPLDVQSIQGAREAFQFRAVLDISNPAIKFGLSQAFFPSLVGFYEREYKDGVRPEVNVATIGGSIGFVGFSGEMFCGHALSLKRRAGMPLFIFGCCNDYQQYFPTIEAQAEGGYGTAPPVAVSEVGAGEKMTDRALIMLNQLRGKLP